MASLLPVLGFAANPFLDAKDDRPVSVKFRGTEWSNDIEEEKIPLAARVITTRVEEMPWGAIFKIEFTDLKSRAEKLRQIRLDYFIVTDKWIVLLNEEDNDAVVKNLRDGQGADVRGARCPRDHEGKIELRRRPVDYDDRDQR